MTTQDPTTQQALAATASPAQRLATVNDDPSKALNALASADNFIAAKKMAIDIANSTLIPEAYRGNVSNVLIAMELASRIGASPLMVMQNLDLIYGRPSWRSSFLIATINASRQFTKLRFRWQGKEGTDEWGCRAFAKDREDGEECIGTLITIKIAKEEGWYDRKGTKWRTIPELMLTYRAAAFWSRIYAPELSMGIHTTEEIIDITPDSVTEASAVPFPRPNGAGGHDDLEAALRAQQPVVTVEKPTSETKPAAAPMPAGGWPPCASCGKELKAEDHPVRCALGEGKGMGWRHESCFAPGMAPPTADENAKWGMTGQPEPNPVGG